MVRVRASVCIALPFGFYSRFSAGSSELPYDPLGRALSVVLRGRLGMRGVGRGGRILGFVLLTTISYIY